MPGGIFSIAWYQIFIILKKYQSSIPFNFFVKEIYLDNENLINNFWRWKAQNKESKSLKDF